MHNPEDCVALFNYIHIGRRTPAPRFDVDAFLKEHAGRRVTGETLRAHVARLDGRADPDEAWDLLKDLAGMCGLLDEMQGNPDRVPGMLRRAGYSLPGLRDTRLLIRGHIEQAGLSILGPEICQDAIEACRALAGYAAGIAVIAG